MRIISYCFFIFLFLFGLIFAFLNNNEVVFNYYFGSIQVSLSLLLAYSLGVGMFLGFIGTILYWLKLKKENIRLKLRLRNADKKNVGLTSEPSDSI